MAPSRLSTLYVAQARGNHQIALIAFCAQVHSFRLQSTQFDKKSYLTYLKGYMKAIKKYLEANNPDRVEAFEKGAQAFAKKGEAVLILSHSEPIEIARRLRS